MSDMDAVRQGMREIDFVLYSSWRLGKHILAGWSHTGNQMSFAFSEPYNVLGRAEDYPRLIRGRRLMGETPDVGRRSSLEQCGRHRERLGGF